MQQQAVQKEDQDFLTHQQQQNERNAQLVQNTHQMIQQMQQMSAQEQYRAQQSQMQREKLTQQMSAQMQQDRTQQAQLQPRENFLHSHSQDDKQDDQQRETALHAQQKLPQDRGHSGHETEKIVDYQQKELAELHERQKESDDYKQRQLELARLHQEQHRQQTVSALPEAESRCVYFPNILSSQ